MVVSILFCVLSFSSPAALASTNAIEKELLSMNTLSIQSKSRLFRSSKWGHALLLMLACYLLLFAVGCGAGVAMSPGGLHASPTIVDFGDVPVDQEVGGSILVSNSNPVSLTISKLSISGGAFSIQGRDDLPISIPAGSSLPLKVSFTPAAITDYSGQLTMMDRFAAPMANIPLHGHGSSGGSMKLTLSDMSLSFGSVVVNTATTRWLTLKSTGSRPVIVNSATITGTGFTLVGGSLPATLNPQQSVTLQVQFKPEATGAASGKIVIGSTSAVSGMIVVSLSGTGIVAANPQLTVSSTNLAFGNVTVNTAKALSLVLTSTGTSAVTVNSAAIAGTGFTIVGGSLPATLNPQQSVTLQVQFKPAATGAVTGKLTISSNSSSGSTTAVALSGTGTVANPQLTVSSTTLSFGSIAVNTATMLSITLKSTGTTPVTVNSAAITGASFSTIGGSFPITLNPSGTATIQVQFKPTAAGTAAGTLTINSNSGTGGTVTVSLSGTGTATAHQVDLSWTAPSSTPAPVKGYNIYRSTGSGAMTLMNPSINTATSYVDSNVANSTSYNYVVKSVDASGVESVGSNQIEVAVP